MGKLASELRAGLIGYVLGLLMGMTLGFLVGLQELPATKAVKVPPYKVNQAAIQTAKKFTVLVTHEGFGGGGRGTGVLIDSNHVLTCAHLIPSADMEIWVYPYPGTNVVKARVVWSSRSKDLAIFELNQPVHLDHYATFVSDINDGEPLTIIGNALGSMKWYITYGLVSGRQGIYVLTDGQVQHGNSGGPWINNNGDVVALSDWALQDKGGCSAGVSGGVSGKVIAEAIKGYNLPSPLEVLFGGR